ncbi:beta strand repeat-containing protein [Aquirufa sp.]|uniref:beta strand repeat-containing protein n=1 Tax=Aquirufa sp. TaxID=2676249 RepID=UPI003784FCAC
MKRLLLVFVLILCSLVGFSQASKRTLNYQAVIIDPSTKDIPGTGLSNQPYANGKVCIRFSFYNPQKQLEYEEIQEDSTDGYGLVDLSIGLGKQPLVYSGNATPNYNSFETVFWSSDTKTLKVAISLDGCKTFSEVSSQLLTYTPYSFYADNVKYSNVQNAPTKLSEFLNDKQFVSLNDLDTLISRVAILRQVVLENTAKINVNTADILLKAPLASPALTGIPTAPTAPNGTNSDQIATTAFVTSMLGVSGTGGSNPNAVSLGGDLGGIKESPTVNTVGGVSSSTISTLPTAVASNTASITSLEAKVQANTLSITSNTDSITGLETLVNSNTASITSSISAISGIDSRVTSNTNELLLKAPIASPSFTGIPTAPTAAAGTSTTQLATTEFVSTILGGTNTPDADATTKGKLKLTNDLGGTANLPTVNSVGGVSSTTIATLPTSVAANTLSITSLTNSVAANTASITFEISRAQNAESLLDTRILSNTVSITSNTSDIALRATIASPSFTGIPTAPTAAAGTSTTQLATTEFVSTILGGTITPDADATTKGKLKLTNDLGGTADLPTVNSVGGVSSTTIGTLPTSVASNTASITVNTSDIALRAPIASPSFTGIPTAPTAPAGSSTNQLATTAFVSTMVGGTFTPDADATNKGKLKLTNDLGGTADLPTVNSVGGVSSSTIATLPTSVASITASITSLSNSVADNTAAIILNANVLSASITAEMNRATAAELVLTNNLNANTNSITANTNSIVANTSSITTNTNSITGLDTRVTSNTASITANTNAITGFDTRITSNTASITTNTNAISGLDTRVTSNTASITANTIDIASNTASITTNTNAISGLDTRVTSNTASITANTINIASNTASITANTNAITGLDTRVTSNTSSITSNTTNIASNTASITANTSAIVSLDTRVTSNTTSITANTNAIAGLDTRVTSNTSSITSNTTDIASNTASITANTIAIAGLETRVTSNTNSITANTSNIASNTASITSNANAIVDLDTRVTSNTASITSNSSAISGLDSRVTSNTSDIALRATINSPSFTGTPTAPTAPSGTNTNQIATTAFVEAIVQSNLQSGISSASTPDATSTTKGKLKLTNDLGGTADLPTVNSVGGVSSATITTLPTLVASNTVSITSNTSDIALRATIASPSFTGTPTAPTAAAGTSTNQLATTAFVSTMVGGTFTPDADATNKGKLKLTNDLGGTADLPTVNSVGGVSSSTIATLPTSVAANTASITSLSNSVTANTFSITSEIARAQNAESLLDSRILSNTVSITSNTSDIALRATISSPSFTGTPTAPTAAAGTSTDQLATTAFVSTMVGGTFTPDADATNKGKLKLTNDLGGTADLPTVNSVGGVSSSTIATLPTSVASITASLTTLTNSLASNTTSNTTAIASNTESITALLTDLALKATINSPSFTGTPTVPSPAANSNSNQIATTAFVTTLVGGASIPDANSTTKGKLKLTNDLGGTADLPTVNSVGGVSSTTIATLPTSVAANTASITLNTSDIALRATIASPSFTGTPTAPTAAAGTSTDQIATTAFVSAMAGGTYTPDADATNKGKLKLTNDLGGTADLPTVNQIGGVSSSTISSLSTTVLAATSSNTANALVKRDASGNFSAATITAALTGNASTATALQTPRSIFGTNFDGTSAISGVISPTFGGTGVNNGNNTITLAGNLSTSGNFNTILTTTAATNITLPTSGILSTLSGTETLTNKTISNAILSGTTSVTGALTVSGSNILTAGGTTFPTATGTTGQVLTLSSAGVAIWSSAGTTVREVFDETTVGASTGTMSATTSLQTNFTLTQTPNSLSKLKMFVNGILISFNAYSYRTDATFATTTTTPTKWVVYNKTFNGSYDISANDRVAFVYFY